MPRAKGGLDALRKPSDGRLERAFSSNHLLAFPEVRLIGDATVFGGALGGGTLRRVQPGPMMLEGMARLHLASDADVQRYAERWGPLRTCVHGFPEPHHHELGCQPPLWDEPDVWASGECADPLTCWRELSNVCRVVLAACDSLHRGRRYAISDEDVALMRKWFTGDLAAGDDLTRQRRELANIIAAWQYHARVVLRPVWTAERPDVRLGGFSLYAALGAQVLMVFAQREGFAVCCFCGTPYIPPRKPRVDEDHYCPACGPRAVQAAKGRYRAKLRRGVHLPDASSRATRTSADAGRPRRRR